MKRTIRLLVYVLLLAVVGATCRAEIHQCWYFKFYAQLRTEETTVTSRSGDRNFVIASSTIGKFDGNQFVVISEDKGTVELTGSSTTRWREDGDHFEGITLPESDKKRVLLRIVDATHCKMKLFAGDVLAGEIECELGDGVLVSRGRIYGENGEVLADLISESKAANQSPQPTQASGLRG